MADVNDTETVTEVLRRECEELRRECEELRREVGVLHGAIAMLAHCKQTDSDYAFYDWLLRHAVLGERHQRLHLVLTALERRLSGQPFDSRTSVPGIPDSLLYSEAPPTREQVAEFLARALEVESSTLVGELFAALRAQGRNPALVDWWMSEVAGP